MFIILLVVIVLIMFILNVLMFFLKKYVFVEGDIRMILVLMVFCEEIFFGEDVFERNFWILKFLIICF